jgi:Cys-tRNA(Pro)/Cys-tRNA(Cys) deacylase
VAGTEKTNAARQLEARGIPHRVTVYDASRAFHSADEAAALVGAPPEAVYKTLVVLREGGAPRAKPLLVLVASDRQVDLKGLAGALGAKRLRMATQAEAETLTGLRVGGISALALKPGAFEVVLDLPARALAAVHVSAGVRGADIELAVDDLIAVTGARLLPASAAR